MSVVLLRKMRRGSADTTPPTISDIFSSPGFLSFTTNEPASTVVEYGSAFSTVMDTLAPDAWWRLGEPSGTSAAEEVGTATGTYANTPTLGVTGIVGGNTAVTLARASAEHIAVPSNMPAGSTVGASIAAWVEFGSTTFDERHSLVTWGPESGTVGYHALYARHFDASTFLLYWAYADGTTYRTAFQGWGTTTPSGQHLVVATHEYAAGGGTIKFYVDGALLATKSHTTYGTPLQVPAGAVTYLGSYNATLHSMNGTLDEPAVWKRVLSAAEVSTLWEARASSDFAYTYTDAVTRTSHSYTIPTLQSGWAYRIKATDVAGNLTTSATQTVGTTPSYGTLQAAIDATSDGGTLNLTGYSYNDQATVSRPMTIVGGTLAVGAAKTALTITASNVTIDGMTITGAQWLNLVTSERAINISGSVSNVTVKNCTLSSFGFAGIWADRIVSGCQFDHNTITDIFYAGIMALSTTGGNIEHNTIKRIGVGWTAGGSGGGFDANNAYAIALSYGNTPSIMSANLIVQYNDIEDVPTWHALDTHGGIDCIFRYNTTRRISRPIFITSGGPSPLRIQVYGNTIEGPGTVTFNLRAITMAYTQDCTVTSNYISSAYPITNDYPANPADNRVDNLSSTNLTVTGNTLI